jgi:hypothetical protein
MRVWKKKKRLERRKWISEDNRTNGTTKKKNIISISTPTDISDIALSYEG